MKDPEKREAIHTQHVKWAIEFSQRTPGMFGWEGPEQEKHRFYEFVRDSNLQGNDLSPYYVPNLIKPPDDFLNGITLARMEDERKNIKGVLSKVAEEQGNVEMDIPGATMKLRTVTDMNPFQIVIDTKANPVVLALWLHILHSRQEGDRVRKCDNCGDIFLREGKKPKTGDRAYCSTSCTRAAVTKRYLANRKDKNDAAKAAAVADQPTEQPATVVAKRPAPAKKKTRSK